MPAALPAIPSTCKLAADGSNDSRRPGRISSAIHAHVLLPRRDADEGLKGSACPFSSPPRKPTAEAGLCERAISLEIRLFARRSAVAMGAFTRGGADAGGGGRCKPRSARRNARHRRRIRQRKNDARAHALAPDRAGLRRIARSTAAIFSPRAARNFAPCAARCKWCFRIRSRRSIRECAWETIVAEPLEIHEPRPFAPSAARASSKCCAPRAWRRRARALPARIFRRPAPAHRHRARAGAPPAPRCGRRTGLRARRFRRRANSGAAAESAARFRAHLILISHSLPVVAQLATRIAVMQAGQIVEAGPAKFSPRRRIRTRRRCWQPFQKSRRRAAIRAQGITATVARARWSIHQQYFQALVLSVSGRAKWQRVRTSAGRIRKRTRKRLRARAVHTIVGAGIERGFRDFAVLR